MDIKEIDVKIKQLKIALSNADLEKKKQIQNELNILNLKKQRELLLQRIRQIENLR